MQSESEVLSPLDHPVRVCASSDRQDASNAGGGRNGTLEVLRIVSAGGVIWFHMETTPYHRVAYAGLVFFLITSVVLTVRSKHAEEPGRYLLRRTRLLLVPWLGWFVIYAVLKMAVGKPVMPPGSGILAGILSGPWIGLWYLPFTLIISAVVVGLRSVLATGRIGLRLIVWLPVSVCSLVAVAAIRESSILIYPWAQWLQAAPSLPIGLAIGAALAGKIPSKQLMLLAGVLFLTCGVIYLKDPGLAVSYSLGYCMVMGAFQFPRPTVPWVCRLSGLCLGVYLIHGAVMSSFKLIPPLSANYVVWFVATVIASFGAVAVMKKVPVLSRIV